MFQGQSPKTKAIKCLGMSIICRITILKTIKQSASLGKLLQPESVTIFEAVQTQVMVAAYSKVRKMLSLEIYVFLSTRKNKNITKGCELCLEILKHCFNIVQEPLMSNKYHFLRLENVYIINMKKIKILVSCLLIILIFS